LEQLTVPVADPGYPLPLIPRAARRAPRPHLTDAGPRVRVVLVTFDLPPS
jgi:hypothetical protein